MAWTDQLRLLEKAWGDTGEPATFCRGVRPVPVPFLGLYPPEHSALMWLSWFFPKWRISERDCSRHSGKVPFNRRKKWQNVFPGYFYAFQFSKHLLLAKCKAVWGNQSYITPPLSSLGCQVLGTKLACKIPPCTLRTARFTSSGLPETCGIFRDILLPILQMRNGHTPFQTVKPGMKPHFLTTTYAPTHS